VAAHRHEGLRVIRAGRPNRASRVAVRLAVLFVAVSCHHEPPAAAPIANRAPEVAPAYLADVVDAARGRSALAVRGPCVAGTCDRGLVDLGTGRARLIGLLDLRGKPVSFDPRSDQHPSAAGMSRSLAPEARLPAAVVVVEHGDAAGASRADLEVIDLQPTPPKRILVAELAVRQPDGGGFATRRVELVGDAADAPLGISISQVMIPGERDLSAPSGRIVHRFVLSDGRYVRIE
jgi:hypothetical protein